MLKNYHQIYIFLDPLLLLLLLLIFVFALQIYLYLLVQYEHCKNYPFFLQTLCLVQLQLLFLLVL